MKTRKDKKSEKALPKELAISSLGELQTNFIVNKEAGSTKIWERIIWKFQNGCHERVYLSYSKRTPGCHALSASVFLNSRVEM